MIPVRYIGYRMQIENTGYRNHYLLDIMERPPRRSQPLSTKPWALEHPLSNINHEGATDSPARGRGTRLPRGFLIFNYVNETSNSETRNFVFALEVRLLSTWKSSNHLINNGELQIIFSITEVKKVST